MRNDGHGAVFTFGGQVAGMPGCRQQIVSRQMLSGKDAVHGLKGELTPGVQEVGEMRLPEAGLAREQGDTERAPLYPAQQFQAEPFVHLSNVHLWIIRCQQWEQICFVFLWKSYQGRLAYIVCAELTIEKCLSVKSRGWIDAQEADS
jgi:hypothetical protein